MWSASALGRLDLMDTMVDADGNLLPATYQGRDQIAQILDPVRSETITTPAPPSTTAGAVGHAAGAWK